MEELHSESEEGIVTTEEEEGEVGGTIKEFVQSLE